MLYAMTRRKTPARQARDRIKAILAREKAKEREERMDVKLGYRGYNLLWWYADVVHRDNSWLQRANKWLEAVQGE